MKNVFTKCQVIGFLLISIFFTQQMSASHLMGADITYKEIDTNIGKYRITVSLYRDCVGVGLGVAQLRVRHFLFLLLFQWMFLVLKKQLLFVCLRMLLLNQLLIVH